jgi:hypothetical protein
MKTFVHPTVAHVHGDADAGVLMKAKLVICEP